MRSVSICTLACATVLAGTTLDARAGGAQARPPSAPPALPPAAAAEATKPVAGIGTPLTAESLQAMRGGESTTDNNVDIRGGVDGNTATDVVSGTNVIQGGSFSNASGISTVIQNSGSNVLIQNGTVVNVQFVDPGQ